MLVRVIIPSMLCPIYGRSTAGPYDYATIENPKEQRHRHNQEKGLITISKVWAEIGTLEIIIIGSTHAESIRSIHKSQYPSRIQDLAEFP
jgi:hypothetical protein